MFNLSAKIKKIKKKDNKYVYDFNLNETVNDELIINLYEPKMNKLV